MTEETTVTGNQNTLHARDWTLAGTMLTLQTGIIWYLVAPATSSAFYTGLLGGLTAVLWPY